MMHDLVLGIFCVCLVNTFMYYKLIQAKSPSFYFSEVFLLLAKIIQESITVLTESNFAFGFG